MWTRAELKAQAKSALKIYYWWAFLACFLTSAFSSGLSFVSSGLGAYSGVIAEAMGGSYYSQQDMIAFYMTLLSIFLVLCLVLTVIAIVLATFLVNVISVGLINFFLESRYKGESAGMGCLLFGFSNGRYLNIVKIMFLRGLYEGLWSLLFVIPGIIKHYEYYMVPFLLADEPMLDRAEAFRLSKQMMDGNKFNTFVLEMSFLGWALLGTLFCGLGVFFIQPYVTATFVEFYLKLKEITFGAPKNDTVYVQ